MSGNVYTHHSTKDSFLKTFLSTWEDDEKKGRQNIAEHRFNWEWVQLIFSTADDLKDFWSLNYAGAS